MTVMENDIENINNISPSTLAMLKECGYKEKK